MLSSAESSPGKGSLSTWWKNFKKSTNLSNDSFDSGHGSIDRVLTPKNVHFNGGSRPLNLKSRSFNSVRPNKEDLIRRQRDEFVASQNQFEFGNEIFGVTLGSSIKVAESLISVPSDDPDEFIRYGKIPLLVGKCGSFLKERGLKVEGIFRVAGASRRVKELQYIFSTPPEYGRKLSWEGYTVHDAASLIRRFLNNLPEPLVPLDLYEAFRQPLQSRPRILNHIATRNETIEKRIRSLQLQQKQQEENDQKQLEASSVDAQQQAPSQPPTEEELEKSEKQKLKDARKQKRIAKDLRSALKDYRDLIDKLPESHKHLLYYLLDLLTMFSDNSRDNLMTARNLAAIFQPSILSHPNHDLSPEEYALSRAVVEVLIEYSKRLLPDVKKFNNDPKTPTLARSAANSQRNSVVNLLAVRNSAKGSRPHSRSLSSASGIPDGITTSQTENEDHNQTEAEDSSDDDDVFHPAIEVPPNKLEIPTITTTDVDQLTPPPPPPQDLPSLPLQKTLSQGTPSEAQFTEATEHATSQSREIPNTKTRPLSMFPGSLLPHHHNNDEERQSRWLSKSPSTDEDFSGINSSKKGSWFKRLRSNSRSTSKN